MHDDSSTGHPAPANADVSRTPRRRILVVDNNASTRRFLVTALSADGNCDVRIAREAEEALEILAKPEPFDLIVCDLMLPGIDGCDLIERLRKEGLRAPILILSSQQSAELLTRALEAGADDYLQKPVDLEELRRAIGMLLARSAARVNGKDKHVPLRGGVVAIRQFEEGPFVELTVATDSAQIESFQRLAERLVSNLMPQNDRVNLRLALEEMIQNAKEWGNRFDVAKKVRLAYCMLVDRIVFRIEDEGAGFEPYSVPDPSIDPRAHIRNRISSGKRMGGWGLFMTRKLMDEVVFNDVGNVVFITKKFRRAEEGVVEILPITDDVATLEKLPEPEAPVPPNPPAKESNSKTRRYLNGEMPWTK